MPKNKHTNTSYCTHTHTIWMLSRFVRSVRSFFGARADSLIFADFRWFSLIFATVAVPFLLLQKGGKPRLRGTNRNLKDPWAFIGGKSKVSWRRTRKKTWRLTEAWWRLCWMRRLGVERGGVPGTRQWDKRIKSTSVVEGLNVERFRHLTHRKRCRELALAFQLL